MHASEVTSEASGPSVHSVATGRVTGINGRIRNSGERKSKERRQVVGGWVENIVLTITNQLTIMMAR